eukprot:scaffold15141_cov101-Isochrysis_galbana.AAC.4
MKSQCEACMMSQRGALVKSRPHAALIRRAPCGGGRLVACSVRVRAGRTGARVVGRVGEHPRPHLGPIKRLLRLIDRPPLQARPPLCRLAAAAGANARRAARVSVSPIVADSDSGSREGAIPGSSSRVRSPTAPCTCIHQAHAQRGLHALRTQRHRIGTSLADRSRWRTSVSS